MLSLYITNLKIYKMENQNTAKKIMLTYGLYIGILSIIVNLVNYSFGNLFEPHWGVMVVGMLIFIGFVVYGIKVFKDLNNGFLKLGQAIKLGLGIALVAAIVGIVYQFLLMYVIEPDYLTKMAEFQEQAMYEKFPDMPEEQLEQAIQMSKKFSGPGILVVMSLAFNLFFGLIVSLIAGAIMKKEEQYA